MTFFQPKHVRYRYQERVLEELYDSNGTQAVPAKGEVVTIGGQDFEVVAVNLTQGAKKQVPSYDVFVQELAEPPGGIT